MDYTELQVTTNFSFLRGASHPEELVEQAAALWIQRNRHNRSETVCRYCSCACRCKKKRACASSPAAGSICWMARACWLIQLTAMPIRNYAALLTTGNLRAEKGECHLYKADVYEHANGIKFIVVPPTELNEIV